MAKFFCSFLLGDEPSYFQFRCAVFGVLCRNGFVTEYLHAVFTIAVLLAVFIIAEFSNKLEQQPQTLATLARRPVSGSEFGWRVLTYRS
jgi:hypothetical protein